MEKEVIYIRIDRSVKEKLDMIALEEDRSLNNLVVRILTKHVERYNKDKDEKKVKNNNTKQ